MDGQAFVLASNNKGKLMEMQKILSELGIEVISMSEAGINTQPEEDGESFAENALIKARAAMLASGKPAMADDSGLVVDALGGEPGVHSARFGGDLCADDVARNALLLERLEGVEKRSARFVSAIACVFPDGRELTAGGTCEGSIALAARGEGGFGYDPLFEVSGGRTMAELSSGEKNLISHRGAALRDMKKLLEIELKSFK